MIIKNQVTTFTITCTTDDCRKSETVRNYTKREAIFQFKGIGWILERYATCSSGGTYETHLCPDCGKKACQK